MKSSYYCNSDGNSNSKHSEQPELHVNKNLSLYVYITMLFSDTILCCSTGNIKILCGRPNFGVIDASIALA